MSGASVETVLELWALSLRDAKARIRPLFTQERVAASAGLFLDGLLGPERRKTGWMRAEAAGDPGPWRQQAILGRGRWDADALRDIVRDYVLETLADPDAVLVIDETGFLKQGKASCGAGRQYTGSVGKITNCQIGVFAAYVSRHGHAFIDRALYLPKAWTNDPTRLAAAHVPPEVGFATKPRIAMAMIERAIAASVPFGWVAADSVYGVGEVEMMLRRAGKGYVLGVNATQQFHSWIGKPPVSGTAAAIAQALDASAWQRLSAGEGTKGARLDDWAYLELADLDTDEYIPNGGAGLWTRGLLVRRRISDGELAFFTHVDDVHAEGGATHGGPGLHREGALPRRDPHRAGEPQLDRVGQRARLVEEAADGVVPVVPRRADRVLDPRVGGEEPDVRGAVAAGEGGAVGVDGGADRGGVSGHGVERYR